MTCNLVFWCSLNLGLDHLLFILAGDYPFLSQNPLALKYWTLPLTMKNWKNLLQSNSNAVVLQNSAVIKMTMDSGMWGRTKKFGFFIQIRVIFLCLEIHCAHPCLTHPHHSVLSFTEGVLSVFIVTVWFSLTPERIQRCFLGLIRLEPLSTLQRVSDNRLLEITEKQEKDLWIGVDSISLCVCLSFCGGEEVMSENQTQGGSRHRRDSHHCLATSAPRPTEGSANWKLILFLKISK